MAGAPPRWLKCPPAGTTVQGTRFVPFKTPLDAQYNHDVPAEYRFHVSDFVTHCKDLQRGDLGLIIDLTKTDRYYDKNQLRDYGCKYMKIACEGYGEAPNDEAVEKFVTVCKAFWAANPDKLIGVHCTHGFNRTGYLICSYMYEQLDMSIEDAIEFFAAARPDGIYKEHYVEALLDKYGGDNLAIQYITVNRKRLHKQKEAVQHPGRPEWEDESELRAELPGAGGAVQPPPESAAANGGAGGGGGGGVKRGHDETLDGYADEAEDDYIMVAGKKRQRYMIGMPEKYGEHASLEQYEHVHGLVNAYVGWMGRRAEFPGSQPVSLDRQNMGMLAAEPFMASWKADGTRYMMLIMRDATFMVDRDNNVFVVRNMHFPLMGDARQVLNKTLLDGELVVDIDPETGRKSPRYLIYDLVALYGQPVGKREPLNIRLKLAREHVVNPRHRIDRTKDPFGVRVKDFWPIQDASKIFPFMEKLSHETDGLIITPVCPAYYPGRYHKLLKWKPADMNSIDFKLRVEVVKNPGEPSRKEAQLWTITDRVGTVSWPKEQLKELNGKIIECALDLNKENPRMSQWRFMRVREDKSLPNSTMTYKGVMKSIFDGVSKEELLEFIEKQAVKVDITKKYPVVDEYRLEHEAPEEPGAPQ